jgi:hypothetical protein
MGKTVDVWSTQYIRMGSTIFADHQCIVLTILEQNKPQSEQSR